MPHNIVPGDVYRHFKGGVYTIVCVAQHTENGDALVVYTSQQNGKTYARPASMFEGLVHKDGCFISRFEKVGDNV